MGQHRVHGDLKRNSQSKWELYNVHCGAENVDEIMICYG